MERRSNSLCVVLFLLFYILLSGSTSAQFPNITALLPCKTFDDCDYGWYSRPCDAVTEEGLLQPCIPSNDSNCMCANAEQCTTSADCFKGSACVKFKPSSEESYCVQCGSLNNMNPPPEQVDDMDVCNEDDISYSTTFDGESLANCASDGFCFSGTCVTTTNNKKIVPCIKSSASDCFCLEHGGRTCDDSLVCQVNSVCAEIINGTDPYCVPCSAIESNNRVPPPKVDDVSLCEDKHESVAPFNGTGTWLEACETEMDCKSGFECYSISRDGFLLLTNCLHHDGCFCMPFSRLFSCLSSDECKWDQGCAKISESSTAYCIPCDSAGNRSPLPEFIDDKHKCKKAIEPKISPTPSKFSFNSPSPSPTKFPQSKQSREPSPSATQGIEGSPSPSSFPFISPGPLFSPSKAPDGNGLTLDSCSSDADCRSPRVCSDFDNFLLDCSALSSSCVCISQNSTFCSISSDCPLNERCYSLFGLPTCISCSFNSTGPTITNPDIIAIDDGANQCTGDTSPEISPDVDAPPCIAVSSLADFKKEQLAYKEHRRAPVLCDWYDNCATAGHVVTYKGVHMMMSRYCRMDDVECRRTVRLVNNPKMRSGLRIKSFSEHLQFTAFSARYETQIEEYLISLVLRTGL